MARGLHIPLLVVLGTVLIVDSAAPSAPNTVRRRPWAPRVYESSGMTARDRVGGHTARLHGGATFSVDVHR
ncbi:MAG TPA: hypothetical protein VGL99_31620 [Chloroflexota bacterium]